LAITLGYHNLAFILESTLNEEKEADQALTAIAENEINYEAVEEM
jgi:ferritin-like metal-binding protein YciE